MQKIDVWVGEVVTDKPVTTYVVSVFEKPLWRTVLVTKDRTEALTMAKEIGDKVRVAQITPKTKRSSGRRTVSEAVAAKPAASN